MGWDLIWPTLSKGESKTVIEQSRNSDIEQIRKSLIKKNSHIVLEEARRLYGDEQERRSGADTKAGMYLTAVTALIALFSSLTPEFETRASSALAFMFAMALIQLLRCGIWSLNALKVKGHVVLDWNILIRNSSDKQLESMLAKKLLCSLRFNYDLNNEKITKINMSHATLISASFWLLIYTILKIAAPFLLAYINNELPETQHIMILCSWCDFSLA